jgi:hypothetical protein
MQRSNLTDVHCLAVVVLYSGVRLWSSICVGSFENICGCERAKGNLLLLRKLRRNIGIRPQGTTGHPQDAVVVSGGGFFLALSIFMPSPKNYTLKRSIFRLIVETMANRCPPFHCL